MLFNSGGVKKIMKQNQKILRAKKFVTKGLQDIDAEFSNHHQNAGTVSNIDELTMFRCELSRMIQELDSENLSGLSVGIGHRIVDSWPLGNELGESLLAAEQEYIAAAKG